MSEQDNSPSGVRRVSPKDRKPNLATGGLQFPPPDDALPDLPSDEERFPPLPPEPKRRGQGEAFPPLAAAPTPMTESEARFPQLATLPMEEAPLPFDDFDDSPPVVTPPEERFPPLPPSTQMIEQPVAAPFIEDHAVASEPDILSKPAGRSSGAWQNAVAVFFVLAAIVVFAVGMMIYFNPYGPLNPFPPATPPPIYITATFAAPAVAPGVTATFTPLPVEMLTEMAPVKSDPQSAAPGPTSLPADSLIDATAAPATPAGPIVGGG